MSPRRVGKRFLSVPHVIIVYAAMWHVSNMVWILNWIGLRAFGTGNGIGNGIGIGVGGVVFNLSWFSATRMCEYVCVCVCVCSVFCISVCDVISTCYGFSHSQMLRT